MPRDEVRLSESRALVTSNLAEQEICYASFQPEEPFDPRLVLWRERDSPAAAGFRLLRQRLIERNDPQRILVTSAEPGEGKSTCAANLALAYAELGRARVLLLEANLSQSSLGEMFGFKPPEGFGRQLSRHRDRPKDPWVVVKVGDGDLFAVVAEPHGCPHCGVPVEPDARFCGECGRKISPGEGVLDGVTFSAAMSRFKYAFDYIIVDAPPVLSSPDVNVIQDLVEVLVLTSRRQHSSAPSLRRALDQVAPAPVAGVILLE
jgi:Mrp family chromosome partitioning ATPase